MNVDMTIHHYAVQTMVDGVPDPQQTQYMASARCAREHAELRRYSYDARLGGGKTTVLSNLKRNVVRVVDMMDNSVIEASR
jgi:hypothetical protein